MNKVLIAAFGATALLVTIGAASAAEVEGGFCKVAEARLSNTGDALIQKKLWEYKGEKLPAAPVMGWIDIGCADVGEPRSVLQDLGKRVWFNVSGPEGAGREQGQLSVSDPNITGLQGDAGLVIRGLALYGLITPKHDCAYQVSVWQASCPANH